MITAQFKFMFESQEVARG